MARRPKTPRDSTLSDECKSLPSAEQLAGQLLDELARLKLTVQRGALNHDSSSSVPRRLASHRAALTELLPNLRPLFDHADAAVGAALRTPRSRC